MIQTDQGPVPVWGRIEAGKPLLFVIRGAFPEANHLSWLVDQFPHLSVALVHVPGMHSPFFADPSVEAFGAAFDQIVDQFGGPTVVLGVSLGGLVAMAMRSPHVERRIILDSPLQTGGLWPILPGLRHGASLSENHDRWVDAMFGVTAGGLVNRDRRHLPRPRDAVLVGEIPLGEPRDYPVLPSLVSDADRAAYLAAGAELLVVPNCGHDIPRLGRPTFLAAIERSVTKPERPTLLSSCG